MDIEKLPAQINIPEHLIEEALVVLYQMRLEESDNSFMLHMATAFVLAGMFIEEKIQEKIDSDE